MTLLATLRHAETDWSREGRIQGRTDVPLSDEGRRFVSAHALPSECVAMRILTSPLRRCVQTAELLGFDDAEREPRLAEMHWGAWEGRRLPELRAELGDAMRDNESRGFDFTPDGGESPRDVLDRVRPWLARVALDGRPALAVTHRGVIRVVFAAAIGWDMLGRPPLKLDWGAVHLFRLDAGGAPSLVRMNLPLAAKHVYRATT